MFYKKILILTLSSLLFIISISIQSSRADRSDFLRASTYESNQENITESNSYYWTLKEDYNLILNITSKNINENTSFSVVNVTTDEVIVKLKGDELNTIYKSIIKAGEYKIEIDYNGGVLRYSIQAKEYNK